jgi:BirA family transcriptional regulator, biotin operon repressor / biotin---[acetyl-CoA-carboxylase] ligase
MDSEQPPLNRELILAGMSRESRRWVKELVVHTEIGSTNTHLMTRAAAENVDGVVCIAERQTGGRGRRGRTWLTPSGGSIALSLGKHVAVGIAEIAPLSLIVGLAVANAMARCGIDGVSLKWPNDILLDGVKVGGILIELAAIAEPLKVITGIGINVGAGSEVSSHLGFSVGDVRSKNTRISRNEIAANLIDSFYESTSKFEVQGFPSMRAEWEALHAHQDRRVHLIGANETVEGIARGVTTSGELILDTDAGIRHFSGGEVSLRGDRGGT